MIPAEDFWEEMKNRGFTFFSGVPCSILKSIINFALNDHEIAYVAAPREDTALGIASGAYLCGKVGGILTQNSGIGNIINPLTSFNLIYRIPVLMVITWRGYQGKDAPEHLVMGEKTLGLLEELGILYEVLEEDNLKSSLDHLSYAIEQKRLPVAMIVRGGILE